MAKRLQELKYHPLGGVVPENAIVLIKDNTTAEYYEDYKLSYQDFTAKLVRQTETSITPLVNQIPRLIAGTGGVPALPAISGEFLINADAAIPVGTDLVFGKLKLSASTSSTSGVTGGFAATPSAVKATYDAAAKKATAETVTANWVFSGTITFNNPIKLSASGSTVGRDATGAFLKNDGTDYIYMKHTGGVASGLVLKVGSTEYKVFHEGNDGAGSGIDADFLDGFHASVFPQKDVAETITKDWNFSTAANVINGVTIASLTTTNRALINGGATFGSYITVLTNTKIDYNAATGADFYNLSANNAIRLHTQAYPIYRSGTTDNKIFHSGYMGTTAGLDAGTLAGGARNLFTEKANNETITGSWTFSGNAVFSGTLTGNLTGSAASLTTTRLINGTGFNGTADIVTASWGTSRSITVGVTSKPVDGSVDVSWSLAEIGALAEGANAVSATKLVTPRAINGTNFDGTAAITTANWGTARTITIGSTGKSVNGSANVSWSLTEIGALALTGTAVAATKLETPRLINGSSFDGTADIITTVWGTPRILTIGTTGKSVTGGLDVSWSLAEIGALAVGANAVSATKLETPRTINGTNFDGTANITTSSWGTSRTLTIGLSGKAVTGSANVTWTLAEIGALALTGGTLTGALTGTQFLASSTNAFMNSAQATLQGMFMDSTGTFIGGLSSGVIKLRPSGVSSSTNETLFNNNGTITASAAATAATHLIRKGEVDTALALKANLAGATFTGKVTFNNSDSGVNIQGGSGATGTTGDFRYNTATQSFEGYTTLWKPIGGGTGVTWTAITANATAEVSKGYLINSSALTVTLPATPDAGASVGIGDYNGNNYSVTIARNGNKIMGKDEDFTFNLKNANIVFTYVDTTVGWILTQGFGESQAPQAIANKRRVINVIGQSTFSIPNQGINTVDVWYNGLKLDPATDYTADSFAGTITLTVPVSANDDILELYNWNQALILDAKGIAYDNTLTGAPVGSMQDAIDYSMTNISGRNLLINGGMQFFQRGLSGSTLSGYTADRWLIATAGAAVSYAQSGGIGGGSANSLLISGAPSNTVVNVIQRIESLNCIRLVGKKVTLSYNIYGENSANIIVTPYLSYATASDNFNTTVLIQAGPSLVGLGIGWNKRKIFTFNALPSTALNGLQVVFEIKGMDATSKKVAISDVQLEIGEVATPFEHKSYADEFRACKRYCQTLTIGGRANAGYLYLSVPLPEAMRVTPTVYSSGYVVDETTAKTVTPSFDYRTITINCVNILPNNTYPALVISYSLQAEL